MRIAVVGAGISGLATAWLLSRDHEVTLFEAGDYLGGHTQTHAVEIAGTQYAVDTGFIVFNPANYPLFTRLLETFGVESQPTTMSFAVRDEATGLEYNAHTLNSMFCQRRNLLSPRFIGMLRDIFRFYREAPALLDSASAQLTLDEYLQQNRYGDAFRDQHIVPMASALWSSPPRQILKFPARYLVQFMANHQMLQAADRPVWRVVRGGSQRYVRALTANWNVATRLRCPVLGVSRGPAGVSVTSAAGSETYDQLVLACHADDALRLLSDASRAEREILGALEFQTNETVLHTDERLLPHSPRAWAAWNVSISDADNQPCAVTYCMNHLQTLDAPVTFCTTLNRTDRIDPARIIARMQYRHPVYSHASVAAQGRAAEIQGIDRTWFAGAYWGWGFHEDGMRSAVAVSGALGRSWP